MIKNWTYLMHKSHPKGLHSLILIYGELRCFPEIFSDTPVLIIYTPYF